MKKIILAISSFTLATTFALGAQAAENAPAANTPATGVSQTADKHPCHAIKQACEAAGFHKGGAKDGKGLFRDCMKPIMAGQSVSGVTVSPADVQACQAAHPHKE